MVSTASKTFKSLILAIGLAVAYVVPASAHVTVKPAQAETAAFQTFTTSVPNEKDNPTLKVRVVIPDGLNYVTPNVKPGWTIETVKTGEGEDADVKEITWSGGSIPAGQRDEFIFSAQLPIEATTLQWKAYQTYQDGEEVAWDQAPTGGGHDDSDVTPYSETKVVKELEGASTATANTASNGSDGRTSLAIGLAVLAIVLSVFSLTRKRT